MNLLGISSGLKARSVGFTPVRIAWVNCSTVQPFTTLNDGPLRKSSPGAVRQIIAVATGVSKKGGDVAPVLARGTHRYRRRRYRIGLG